MGRALATPAGVATERASHVAACDLTRRFDHGDTAVGALQGVSLVTALIGVALGLPLGVFLGALVTEAGLQSDLSFSIPFGQLVFAVVIVIVGILAAVMHGRASRLNVLEALQCE
jgi:hypothetical protein